LTPTKTFYPVLVIYLPEPQKRSEETASNSRETSDEEGISSYLFSADLKCKTIIPSLYLSNDKYYKFKGRSHFKVIFKLFTIIDPSMFSSFSLCEVHNLDCVYYNLNQILCALPRNSLAYFDKPSGSGVDFASFTHGQEILSLLSLLRILLPAEEADDDINRSLKKIYGMLCNLYVG
jgi:hypothetical protein